MNLLDITYQPFQNDAISFDPLGRRTVKAAGSDQYFTHVTAIDTIFQNLVKQNHFQLRNIVSTTIMAVGLAEEIIDNTCRCPVFIIFDRI